MNDDYGYDPLGSCFIFDFDPVEAGLNVVPLSDAPMTRHELTDEDKGWLTKMKISS
jgi:hypothetical protein